MSGSKSDENAVGSSESATSPNIRQPRQRMEGCMADIIRRAAVLAINRASHGNIYMQIRTLFSSSGIGIDNFKLSREQHATRFAPSLDVFKKRFLDSIGQKDSQIFTEDLRNMIMSANTDPEIDSVIQALKKYSANTTKLTDYHFGSPVMRLLYTQNKTDLALQLYMDENLKTIFNDSASALVLMNKLIEDKRYDDAVKVFEFGSKRGFSTTSGRTFPTDVVMLAIEGLYRQNTKESLVKAKELITKVRERDADRNPRTAAMTALLAIQQGEPQFAMEVLGSVRAQNFATVPNIRAICYSDMGRVEEAINVVHLLAEKTPVNSDRRRVFPLVMRHIRTAVEKTKDESLLTRFEELSKFVLKNNRLSTTDLPEYLSELINRRGPTRQNTQQNVRGSFQRTVGNLRNRGDSNQGSDNSRQGNRAYVLPPLRHLLLQLLTELEIGCSLSGKEQASRLLGQLIANTPRIVRPYMQSITQALLPLIKLHEQHSNVLIALVRTVGEQAQVCGIDLDQRIHDLFPILINMMQDTSNYRKREVALWTIGQIVESCCYVIETLQKYPILLDVLLQFLKSEETPFRRETIRVLGFLGAIDPYHVRSSNDPLRSLSYDVNDITLTHRVRDEPDPIEISSNELLVASGAISLHDFYTKMAINVCLRVLKDSNTPQLHLKAVQAISIILQWLGSTCTQYVSLVLPRLLSVVRNTDDRNLVPYFRQINIIIISIKSSITPYVNDVVQLIRDYWDSHSELQILLIQTIEALAAALDSEFHHYIHLLLPFVMKTFRIDTNNVNINQLSSSNPNQDRQLILSQMFSTLNKFGKTLKPHFNVVLPSILDIASTSAYPIKLRQEALDTIEQLADKVFLSDYVSAILQILLRIIRKTTQLQMKCLDIILILAQQMGKHFLVFSSLVSKTMDEMKLQHSKYELYISKLKDSSFVDVQSEIIINSNNLLNQTTGEQKTKDEKMLYTMRTVQLSAHWTQAMQRNAKDLPM
ncbi:unnamed protein product, partial [Adineta steineri]